MSEHTSEHTHTPLSRTKILREISAERNRQIEKWGEQRHKDGTSLNFMAAADDAKGKFATYQLNHWDPTWQMILDEEVLEAFSETDCTRLREELIQVAAVAVAWIEDLDRPSVPKVPGPPYPMGPGPAAAIAAQGGL